MTDLRDQLGAFPDAARRLLALCRVRDCINAQHLEPVTHLENVRRRRDNPHECANGHPFTEENTHWYTQKGRSNVVRKCRRCKKESNAARPRRSMTEQDKERLAARDRRGRKRARSGIYE